MSSPRWVDRLRHHVRRPLGRAPFVWDAAMLARQGKRATLVRRDSALVIEGFPRSGNTFSVAAFQVANGTDLHLGRHLHGAPHLLRAARLGVPAVVLIRQPAQAVASYLVRRPSLTPDDALLEYLDFYRTAWRVRDRLVVGLFDDVIEDFGGVIRQVNSRFGTNFRPYVPTEDNRTKAFALVEEMNRLECGGQVVETHVGRPSERRDGQKQAVLSAMHGTRAQTLTRTAEDLYAAYSALVRTS